MELNYSADYGQTYVVQVIYNTDGEGRWLDEDGEHPFTLHGPFDSKADAVLWMDNYPDDTDIHEIYMLTMNKVHP